MFPHSFHHDSGEIVEFDEDGAPARVSSQSLQRAVAGLAATTLLARHWPRQPGSRHDLALALSGYLLRAGIPPDLLRRVIETAARIAGDSESRSRGCDVATTAAKLAAGAPVIGGPHLADLLDRRVTDRLIEWLGGRKPAAGAALLDGGWPALQPLPDDALPPVPTLPGDLVPAAWRPWLTDAAERLDVPLEMVVVPALVMLGGVIGRRLCLSPKHHDDWRVVPNVWGAVIARPGFLKTPAMHEAKRFLSRLAAAATEWHTALAAAMAIEREIVETEIKKLKRDATLKGGKPEAMRATLEELTARLAAAVAIPTRFYTNDSTVEKLGMLLNENPTGLLLLRDELAGWLHNLEKPGREGDREFFLEAWNGVGDFYVDRIGRGTLHIPALTIGICGTMQPGKLQAYVTEAIAEGRGADGLLQRFQLLVWPDFSGEWRNVDRPPDIAARERAGRVFEAVAALPGSEAAAPVCPRRPGTL